MHFILRKYSKDANVEMNFMLGKHYTIEFRESNPEDFDKRFSYEKEVFGDDLYGMVCDVNSEFHFLFKKQHNYIMTDSGQTFANVTYR